MDMDKKEEIVEEMLDIEEVNDSNTNVKEELVVETKESDKNITQTVKDQENKSGSNNDIETSITKAMDELDLDINNIPEEDLSNVKSKGKVPIIILLSILLFIDLAALVAYIIGFDKVLSYFM